MNIKIYTHATDVAGNVDITTEQIALLISTGLIYQAKDVIICTHYNENSYDKLKKELFSFKNVSYRHFNESYKSWYEYTTCLELMKDCENLNEEFYVLYFHTKGAFHNTNSNYFWRKYMEYFCIERWNDCIEKLSEGYETCGVGYMREEENIPPYNFYAGNFFWAKSSYINRCRRLKEPPEVNFTSQFEGQDNLRYDPEYWNGTGKPKWYDLDPGPAGRWYSTPNQYRHDLKK